jgi:hypothetical protein
MNPRLEDLRKRLLPSFEPAGSSDAIFARSSQSAAIDRSKQPGTSAAEAAERNSVAQGPSPVEPVAEQKPDNEDAPRGARIATRFEPAVEPLGMLRDQVVDFLNAIQAQLADMAKSLEAAKALRLQLTELVQALDAGSELQAQTYELSKALGVALQANRTKGN